MRNLSRSLLVGAVVCLGGGVAQADDINTFTVRGHVIAIVDTAPPVVHIADFAHFSQILRFTCGGGTNCKAMHDADPGPGIEMKPVLLGDCPYTYTALPDGPYFWACTVDENNEDTYGECVNAGGWLRNDGVNPLYGSLWGITVGTDCTTK